MTDPDSERSPKPEASRPADDQGADTAVPHDEEPDESGSDSLRDLLRGAAAQDEPPMPDVLRGVQRKIRVRSRGKYFADVWSTSRQPPISTYLVTSLVMLAIAAFVYVVLSPLSGEPVKVEPPAPINVVPPSPY